MESFTLGGNEKMIDAELEKGLETQERQQLLPLVVEIIPDRRPKA